MTISLVTMPTNKTKYLTDYQPSVCGLTHTHLTFVLDEAQTEVTALLHIIMHNEVDLVLDGVALELLCVQINDTTIPNDCYEVNNAGLTIPLTTWHPFGKSFMLTTKVHIAPAKNTELMGLYTSADLLCTQCEPEGFRRITYYIDRPDVLSQFTVTLTADKTRYPVLLAGGNKTDYVVDETSNSHTATYIDPHPKPSYLFALVAGDLINVQDQHTTTSGRCVDIYIHSTRNNAHKLDFALSVIKRSMIWDEQQYGCEYDLDAFHVVAADDFNSGAMENKGLNIFNAEALLAHPETTTDAQYMRIEAIIAHEYFHNWSGNRVTCRDWFQLSLKEGLTVFREAHYMADTYSHALRRIEDVLFMRTYQFAEDAGGFAHSVQPPSYEEIANFYTATVYEKGAEVLRMVQTLVGKKAFNDGCRLYFARHDGQAATIEDFVACIAETSNTNLAQCMRWYTQAGTPHVSLNIEYNKSECTLTIVAQQSCRATQVSANPQPFVIPIVFELLDEQGAQLQTGTLVLQQVKQSFVINDVQSVPVLSAFNNFSAPVTWHIEQLIDNKQANITIAAHAHDLFAQWNSSRNLLSDAIHSGEIDHIQPCFASWLKQALHNPTDATVLRDFFALPTVRQLLNDNTQNTDVMQLCNKRRAVIKQIAQTYSTQWQRLYTQCRDWLDTQNAQEIKASVSVRSLAGSAIEYLMAHESNELHQLASAQYHTAVTMTDCISALRLLIEYRVQDYQDALADFYERFQTDSIVLAQWFRLQAGSRHATPAVLEELFAHPRFSWKNPNLLRATIGAYITNMETYHAPSNESYDYIASKLIYVDSTNSKIAARLAAECAKWQGLDDARIDKMKHALHAIAPKASAGLREVIAKAVTR